MQKVITWLQARYKAVTAFLGMVLVALQAFNVITQNHWITVAIGVLTVLGVHQVSNQGA